MKVPELRAANLAMLASLVDHQRKPELEGDQDENQARQYNQSARGGMGFGSRIVALRDQCKSLMETNESTPIGGTSPKGQWIQSRLESGASVSRGPISRWKVEGDIAMHLAGETESHLYFQSPLRGSFTATADVATSRWNEPGLMYNGRWAGPDHSKKMIVLGGFGWNSFGPKLEPALEFDDRCTLKLEVVPQKVRYYINDRQVDELMLPDKPNPWLALTSSSGYSGQLRLVRITGSPEIPQEVELTGGDDLTGWSAAFYGDQMSNQREPSDNMDSSNDAWKKFDGELIGTKFSKVADKKRASLIRYHRPLAEDGELTYEFYYIKDETHVHPALGRIAFLLNTEGVKQQWLGDHDCIRYGLSAENEIAAPSNRKSRQSVPLKENDWNTLQIKITGDQVKLILNRVEIYEAQIEQSNQREFGLFHYANETDVRVRNVVYRGEWPKTLPEVNQQELSGLEQ